MVRESEYKTHREWIVTANCIKMCASSSFTKKIAWIIIKHRKRLESPAALSILHFFYELSALWFVIVQSCAVRSHTVGAKFNTHELNGDRKSSLLLVSQIKTGVHILLFRSNTQYLFRGKKNKHNVWKSSTSAQKLHICGKKMKVIEDGDILNLSVCPFPKQGQMVK